jgi:hypothetical protein
MAAREEIDYQHEFLLLPLDRAGIRNALIKKSNIIHIKPTNSGSELFFKSMEDKPSYKSDLSPKEIYDLL